MEDRYLFRGKRTNNGEWVEGCLFCTDDYAEISNANDHHIEIIPSTICQCTGIKDKNGKLIWENDVVRHYNNLSCPNQYDVGLILFHKNSPGFERTSRMHDDNVGICADCIYEVVGNKFDNSDLLEVQK